MASKIDYDILNDSYKGLVEIVGIDNMLKIRDNYRGMQVQLPMRLYDADKLRKKLKTMNVRPDQIMTLSHEYGFSPRWIKDAIK